MDDAIERDGSLPQALPPRWDTRAPSWSVPEGAVDTHFHIFGPQARFPFASTRRYDAREAPYEQWRRMADVTGISRGVAVQGSIHGTDNAAMLDAVARGAGRLRGVARITRDMSMSELCRLRDAGVVGARFSILSDRPGTISEVEWAAPLLAELGWSIDLHLSPQALVDHQDVIRALQVPVVIDHMANMRPADGIDHPAMSLMLDLLQSGNVWVKIAAVHKLSSMHPGDISDEARPYIDVVERARILVENAEDRVLWGTDYPHGNIYKHKYIPNEGDLIDLILDYAPTPEFRRKLLVDNAVEFYGFDS